jgi:hypothetical protein
VTAAARDHYPLDRRLANQARLTFAAVDSMLQLKKAFFPIGADVIGNGRTARGNRLLQNFF